MSSVASLSPPEPLAEPHQAQGRPDRPGRQRVDDVMRVLDRRQREQGDRRRPPRPRAGGRHRPDPRPTGQGPARPDQRQRGPGQDLAEQGGAVLPPRAAREVLGRAARRSVTCRPRTRTAAGGAPPPGPARPAPAGPRQTPAPGDPSRRSVIAVAVPGERPAPAPSRPAPRRTRSP